MMVWEGRAAIRWYSTGATFTANSIFFWVTGACVSLI
jgi:hypothetical protein